MRKLVVVVMLLVVMIPVQARAANPYGLFEYDKPNDYAYPPWSYSQPYWSDEEPELSEVPKWVKMSMRNQVAKRLHLEFGSSFHFIQDDPENPDVFFIDAVGDGGGYWARVELTQLPGPKTWGAPSVFQVNGYGVGNGTFFMMYGFFSNGLKLKVIREGEF